MSFCANVRVFFAPLAVANYGHHRPRLGPYQPTADFHPTTTLGKRPERCGGPLTEIPEHLLKRSKAAKAEKSGEAAEPEAQSSVAPAAGVPSAQPAPAPANLPNLDPEPEPAKPEPAYVTASKRRRRMPMWAVPLMLTPIWAYSYAGTMQEVEHADPLFTEGAEVYVGCAGCHGSDGGGGSGYQLSDGQVLQTFPDPIDQMAHVARGSAAIQGETYGADGRRVAGELGQMPAHLTLSLVELEMVVFHERAVLSGEDTSSEAYQAWMEEMRHAYDTGEEAEIDLDFLLACANPEVTPGATGTGSPDEDRPCPGPHGGEEIASE